MGWGNGRGEGGGHGGQGRDGGWSDQPREARPGVGSGHQAWGDGGRGGEAARPDMAHGHALGPGAADPGGDDQAGRAGRRLTEAAWRLRQRAERRLRARNGPDRSSGPATEAPPVSPTASAAPTGSGAAARSTGPGEIPVTGPERSTLPGEIPAAGKGSAGSLRKRLLWSFVGVAALAALIVGVVTLSLVRLASVSGLEQQLRDQAEAASVTIGGGPAPCPTLAALRAVHTELYLVSADGSPQAVTCRPFRGRFADPVAPTPDVDLREALSQGSIQTGSRGTVVYAVAPLPQPLEDLRGVQYTGVLLTHSSGGLAVGLVGGVAWRLLLATGLAMAIAAFVAWLLAGRLTAPLRHLAGAARQLGAGQLSTRVKVEGDDEVAEVGAAFNEMAADIEHSQGEQRAFLASISHELKTPLTAVQGYTEALLDGTISDPPDRQRTLVRIHGETLRLARLVQDLIDLARLGRGQFAVSPVDADVSSVVREAVAAAGDRALAQGVSVEQRVPNVPLLAHVDPGRLRQVIDNLLDNATRSSPVGNPVLVAARPLAGGWVEVAVVDRGPGIAAEDLPRAFDRGYLWSRYRGTRTVGSGLGLAIVKALCDAMGVEVRAESGREYGRGGTAFRLALPPARPSPSSWAPPARELPTPR
jgi:two-component system OmpR family sensor kinase